MKDINNNEQEALLFYPKNERDLRHLYPELSTMPDFKGLTGRDMMFIWWCENPSSPYVLEKLPDPLRISNAIGQAWGKIDTEKARAYISGNIPDNIRRAMDKMASFDPPARIKAKIIVNKIFNNFEKIVDVDVTDVNFIDKDGNTDWSKKKAYIDACTNVSDALPKLLKQLEEGFGITVKDDKNTYGSGVKAIDRFHQNNKS